MKQLLQVFEVILAILLMASILLQQRGAGLGGTFGGEGGVYRSRRGAEGFLFRSTIILGVLFVGVAITVLIVNRT